MALQQGSKNDCELVCNTEVEEQGDRKRCG